MSLTSILNRPGFKTGDYTVTRRAAPTLDASGAAVAGATSTFTTGPASLQPLRGRELRAVPDGVNATDTRRLMTTAALVVLPVPDEVTIDGEPWQVFTVDGPWVAFGGTHYNAMLVRKSVAP